MTFVPLTDRNIFIQDRIILFFSFRPPALPAQSQNPLLAASMPLVTITVIRLLDRFVMVLIEEIKVRWVSALFPSADGFDEHLL